MRGTKDVLARPSKRLMTMTFKTVETVMYPDGRLGLPSEEMPHHPVRVHVTFLETDEAAALAEPGDYLATLEDYEERLAKGEIRWQ
jgi:hypothetical protein